MEQKIDTFIETIKKIALERGFEFPNTKQLKFLEIFLMGGGTITKGDALVQAGYSKSNHIVTARLDCFIQAYNEITALKISGKLVDKKDLIDVLKDIIKTDPDNRLKILAIQTLSKIMGLDAPTRVESKQEVVHTVMAFGDATQAINQLQEVDTTNTLDNSDIETKLLTESVEPIDIETDDKKNPFE